MGLNMVGWKVAYKERVYNVIDIARFDFKDGYPTETVQILKPNNLEIIVIDDDGEPAILSDERFMFHFFREKAGV